VPYFGEPVRGGIRVYDDDKLAFIVKKRMLEDIEPASTSGGMRHYKLLDLLRAESPGAPVDKLVEGWVIADEERKRKMTREELDNVTVAIGDKHKTEVDIGAIKMPVTAIALHTHHVGPDELPQIRPDERD